MYVYCKMMKYVVVAEDVDIGVDIDRCCMVQGEVALRRVRCKGMIRECTF
jgi:hypothetical protein